MGWSYGGFYGDQDWGAHPANGGPLRYCDHRCTSCARTTRHVINPVVCDWDCCGPFRPHQHLVCRVCGQDGATVEQLAEVLDQAVAHQSAQGSSMSMDEIEKSGEELGRALASVFAVSSTVEDAAAKMLGFVFAEIKGYTQTRASLTFVTGFARGIMGAPAKRTMEDRLDALLAEFQAEREERKALEAGR